MRIIHLLTLAVLTFSSCNNNDKPEQKLPDISFNKAQWKEKKGDSYTYRKQMVKDLLHHYKWSGITKDSLVQMLGQPDKVDIPEGLFMYDYNSQPGFIGTTIEALVFEMNKDSTVKLARLSN
jgi:hypothetical protein